MANRAYLYSSDRPDAWGFPDEDYYDSRHTIPLAWFFFYQPGDIRIVNVHYNGSHWQEVKFSTEKESALVLFAARQPLVMSLVEGRISAETVTTFVTTVAKRRGRFLQMNPGSVLSAMPDDDPIHAERFARILELLGRCEGSGEEAVREAIRPYVGSLDADRDRSLRQVIGYTYVWPRRSGG
ncbi:MAG: hypothetical protein HY040_12415 [Planctomycetes bacterium]|nr:hypothetical protein [Planctomycetota bacterium]